MKPLAAGFFLIFLVGLTVWGLGEAIDKQMSNDYHTLVTITGK